MIRIYQRATNNTDLAALTRGRGSLKRNLLTVSLPIAIVVFGVVYLKWRSGWVAAGIAAGLFIASLVSNIRFFRKSRHRGRQMADDKAVETLEVSATRILDIEFVGDQGPAYCFFVDEGKALLLVGQWLLECPSFPSANFRLHCWSDNRKPIRIEPLGPTVQAEHSTAHLKREYRFKPIELLRAAPETLQRDLDNAFTKHPLSGCLRGNCGGRAPFGERVHF